MKKNEECKVCMDVLSIGCEKFDERYCNLKEKYVNDPNMGVGDVIEEMTLFSTPEQREIISDTMVERGLATW